MPFRFIKQRTLSQFLHVSVCASFVLLLLIGAFVCTVHCRAVIPNNDTNGKVKLDQKDDKNGNGGLVDLVPPKHLDGVRMDRDGELNKEFRQEVFLGPDHEDFDSIPEKEGRKRLIEIFGKYVHQ